MDDPVAQSDARAMTPDATLVAGLGRTIRSARRDRGLTVEALARQAGVSTGLISQLERGLGNPSFLTLQRLAEALELPFGYFMQGPPSQNGMVVRAGQRKRLVTPHPTEIVHELLTPDLQGALEVLRTTVPAGWANEDQPFRHRGEECVHILAGTLEVTVGGRTYLLETGDSITYDSDVPHWYANRSDGQVLIIGAVTPPSF